MKEKKRNGSAELPLGNISPTHLMNAFACPIYYQNMDGAYTGCNTAFADLIAGLPFDEIIGRSTTDLSVHLPPGLVELSFENELALIHRDGRQCREVVISCTDGQSREFAIHTSLLNNDDGDEAGIAGMMVDISTSKQKEADLTTANNTLNQEIEEGRRAQSKYIFNSERYHRIFENTGAATVLIDPDMTISMANAKAEQLTGLSRRQFVGRKKMLDFVASAHRERLKLYHELRLKGDSNVPRRFEFQSQDAQGKIRDLLTSVQFIPETKQVVASMLDITHSNQVQKERQRLAAVIDQSSEAVIITDTHSQVEYTNPAFEALSGYDRQASIGQNMDAPFFSDADRNVFRQMTFTVSAEDSWSGRIQNRHKDGRDYITDTRVFPICDAKGKAINLVCVKKDVTREAQIEKQLQHAQKMEAIGTLAGGIAHDFNNILGGILGYTEICRLNAEPQGQLHRYLGRILDGCQRAKELVGNILAFSRKQDEEAKPLEVQMIVKEALKLLRASTPSTVEFKQRIGTDPCIVEATPTQIHQIIMNLCTNASQAMQETGGQLSISCEKTILSSDNCKEFSGLTPGSHVSVTVSDTGPGISETLLSRIFEPYFTTKAQTGGTGLGLSVVHGIVKNIGGNLSASSQPGHGSTFVVYLPCADEQAPADIPAKDEIPKGSETILVVDDELFILEIMSDMLHAAGYKVETTNSSAKALQLFQETPDQFDLVIADHTMPKITGTVLAKEIKALRPDIPIILATGLTFDDATPKETLSDFAAVLKKPILYKDLAVTLRNAIDDAKRQ